MADPGDNNMMDYNTRRPRSRNSVTPVEEPLSQQTTTFYTLQADSPIHRTSSLIRLPRNHRTISNGSAYSQTSLIARAQPPPRRLLHRKWCKFVMCVILVVCSVLAVVCLGYLLYLIVSKVENSKQVVQPNPTIVSTDEVEVTVRITNVEYVSDMNNESTATYRTFNETFCAKVVSQLDKQQSSQDTMCRVISLSSGSVIVDFKVTSKDIRNTLNKELISSIFNVTDSDCQKERCFNIDPTSITIHGNVVEVDPDAGVDDQATALTLMPAIGSGTPNVNSPDSTTTMLIILQPDFARKLVTGGGQNNIGKSTVGTITGSTPVTYTPVLGSPAATGQPVAVTQNPSGIVTSRNRGREPQWTTPRSSTTTLTTRSNANTGGSSPKVGTNGKVASKATQLTIPLWTTPRTTSIGSSVAVSTHPGSQTRSTVEPYVSISSGTGAAVSIDTNRNTASTSTVTPTSGSTSQVGSSQGGSTQPTSLQTTVTNKGSASSSKGTSTEGPPGISSSSSRFASANTLETTTVNPSTRRPTALIVSGTRATRTANIQTAGPSAVSRTVSSRMSTSGLKTTKRPGTSGTTVSPTVLPRTSATVSATRLGTVSATVLPKVSPTALWTVSPTVSRTVSASVSTTRSPTMSSSARSASPFSRSITNLRLTTNSNHPQGDINHSTIRSTNTRRTNATQRMVAFSSTQRSTKNTGYTISPQNKNTSQYSRATTRYTGSRGTSNRPSSTGSTVTRRNSVASTQGLRQTTNRRMTQYRTFSINFRSSTTVDPFRTRTSPFVPGAATNTRVTTMRTVRTSGLQQDLAGPTAVPSSSPASNSTLGYVKTSARYSSVTSPRYNTTRRASIGTQKPMSRSYSNTVTSPTRTFNTVPRSSTVKFHSSNGGSSNFFTSTIRPNGSVRQTTKRFLTSGPAQRTTARPQRRTTSRPSIQPLRPLVP